MKAFFSISILYCAISLGTSLTLPQRSKRDTIEVLNATKLCDHQELEKVVDEHEACYKDAEKLMLKDIAADNITNFYNGLCNVIEAKVECILTFAPKCLQQDKVDMMKETFLRSELHKAEDNSDLLGQDFITSCPELKTFQDNMEEKAIKDAFGSDNCSYEQAVNKTTELEICKLEALDIKNLRESVAVDFLRNLDKESKSAALSRIYCDFKNDWLACFDQTAFECTSEAKRAEILKSEEDDFKNVVMNFGRLGVKISLDNCTTNN